MKSTRGLPGLWGSRDFETFLHTLDASAVPEMISLYCERITSNVP